MRILHKEIPFCDVCPYLGYVFDEFKGSYYYCKKASKFIIDEDDEKLGDIIEIPKWCPLPDKPEYCELHIWCEYNWGREVPKPEECPYFESFKEEKKEE